MTIRLRTSQSVCLLLLMAALADLSAVDIEEYEFKGRVIDGLGQPVEGATVSVLAGRVSTSSPFSSDDDAADWDRTRRALVGREADQLTEAPV